MSRAEQSAYLARIEAENRELRAQVEATKALLAATQEMQRRTIVDFCALRDALPRDQVKQILAAVEGEQP